MDLLKLNLYLIIYMTTNILYIYIMFKLMDFFFCRSSGIKKKREMLSYLVAYIIISGIYVIGVTPLMMIFVNLLVLLGISFNYPATKKNRILNIVFIYSIIFLIECVLALCLGHSKTTFLEVNRYSSEFGVICVRVISLTIIHILTKYKKSESNSYISTGYQIATVLFPFGSLYVLLLIYSDATLTTTQILITTIMFLFFNLFIFYLYDELNSKFNDIIENKILRRQNIEYSNQLDLFNQSQQSMKKIRHDLNNHIQSLYTYLNKNDTSAAVEYLEGIYDFVTVPEEYVESGNIEIDSILNFKIHQAMQYDIEVVKDIQIPEKINISAFDINIIVGNLMDNAIYATSKLADKNERKIWILVKMDRNILNIKISNTYDGVVIFKGNSYRTMKPDVRNHGQGIISVKQTIEKYRGDIEILHYNQQFIVNIFLYNKI